MWRGRGKQSISCVYTQGRGARQVCAVFPQAKGFCLTQISSTLFTVPLIFYLLSLLQSCGAKHVFVLQNPVWCWRSLGSELRLVTDGQVSLWPWYPAFQPTKIHLCCIRRKPGEAPQEKPKNGGDLLLFFWKSVFLNSPYSPFWWIATQLSIWYYTFNKVTLSCSLYSLPYVTVCMQVTLKSAAFFLTWYSTIAWSSLSVTFSVNILFPHRDRKKQFSPFYAPFNFRGQKHIAESKMSFKSGTLLWGILNS